MKYQILEIYSMNIVEIYILILQMAQLLYYGLFILILFLTEPIYSLEDYRLLKCDFYD